MQSILIRYALLTLAFACITFDASASPVNINTADAASIATGLKGIGLKRAQAIVEYRAKHGPFKSADELALVKGIGRKAIDRNRNDIRVDAARAAVTAQQPASVAAPRKPPVAGSR